MGPEYECDAEGVQVNAGEETIEDEPLDKMTGNKGKAEDARVSTAEAMLGDEAVEKRYGHEGSTEDVEQNASGEENTPRGAQEVRNDKSNARAEHACEKQSDGPIFDKTPGVPAFDSTPRSETSDCEKRQMESEYVT